jgi:hypothetical protein
MALVLTSEGSGYSSAPAVSFSGGNPKTEAVATAIIQPAGAVLIKEDESRIENDPMDGLYVLVRRVYHTLPGPILATRIIGSIDVVPEKFRIDIGTTTAKQRVLAGTTPDDPSGDLRESKVEDTSVIEAIKENVSFTVPLPRTLTGSQVVTQFGGAILDVIETVDGGPQVVDTGLGVLESEVIALGGGNTLKKTIKFPGGTTAWPILTGTLTDEGTGIVINFTKQVVPAGTTGGITTQTIAGKVIKKFTEIQPLDAWRSIAVTSWVPAANLPATISYPCTVDVSDPDTAVNAQDSATSGYAYDEAHGSGAIQGASGPKAGTCQISYVVGADVASVSVGTTRRTTPISSTPHVWTYANTGTVPYAKAQAWSEAVSGFVTGTVVSLQIEQLRFDVFRVRKISVT